MNNSAWGEFGAVASRRPSSGSWANIEQKFWQTLALHRHDLTVSVANDPPAFRCDAVLALDEVVEGGRVLELPEAIYFKDELARSAEGEIDRYRAEFALGGECDAGRLRSRLGLGYALTNWILEEILRVFCVVRGDADVTGYRIGKIGVQAKECRSPLP